MKSKENIKGQTVTTNNRPIDVFTFEELNEVEQEDFDYGENAYFFRAYNNLHCLADFERLDAASGLAQAGWTHGRCESAWDALLIKILPDHQVIVGRANW